MVREPGGEDRWSQAERTWGEYEEAGFLEGSGPLSGAKLRASIFVETYRNLPADASVCLSWGDKVSGIVKNWGRGKIWLIGTAVGPGATAYVDEFSAKGIRTLLKAAVAESEYKGKLLVQKRVFENQEAWLITNRARERVSEKIPLPEGKKVKEMLAPENLSAGPGAAGSVMVSVDPLDVQVLILE